MRKVLKWIAIILGGLLGLLLLAAIIANVKSVPLVNNELPDTKAGPLGLIFVALGMFDVEGLPLIPAEVIDHSAPIAKTASEIPSTEYEEYLVSITVCTMCHGQILMAGLHLSLVRLPHLTSRPLAA